MVARLAVAAGVMLLLGSAASFGQEGIADQLYGAGVHAFFEGDYSKAHKLLTDSLEAGGRDPRVYYFRGLASAKLGRPEDAELDFAKGAELESSDVERLYNISKAMERVQGEDRLKIEKHRVKARVAAYQKAETRRKARYEELRREESRVLEQQSRGAPPAPGLPLPVAPDVGFGEPPTTTATGPAVEPVAPPEPNPPPVPDASLDAESPVPTPPPADTAADPFALSPVEEKAADAKKAPAAGTVPATPKKKKAARPKPPTEDSDPFAAPAEEKKAVAKEEAPTEDADPFATSIEEKKPSTKKKPAAEDEDPFAEPAEEKKKAGAKNETPIDETDPFAAAEEKKAAGEKAAEDADPFAEPPQEKKAAGKKPATKKPARNAKAKPKTDA